MPSHCSNCQKALEPSSAQDLCPECLIKAGFATGEIPPAGHSTPLRVFQPPALAQLAPLFPQLEILKLLGQGGMGAVYQARQKALDRIVALKILPPDIGQDPAFAERFTREAKALAKLNHPGIVTLYEFGVAAGETPVASGGLYYFLMEFVDGVNLHQLLARGRLSAREALAIVPQICDALQCAHDQGIVHRDIKPENILLDRQGHVKVADFGLAKIVDSSRAEPRLDAVVRTELSPNPTGILGTPQYMAPEQREHPTEVDHRSDIFALGVVFYQMLTGELPEECIEPPSRKVQIDVRLDEVVLRALEQQPERRYPQASDLKTQLETIAGTPSPNPDSAQASQSLATDSTGMLAQQPRRYSWAAVAGGIWIGLSFLNYWVSYTPPGWTITQWLRNSPFQGIAELCLLIPLMILGFAALVGGSLMGVIALHQIRQARAERHGFGLALFDVLFFPLFLLNGWAIWLVGSLASQLRGFEARDPFWANPSWTFALLALGVVALNAWLIRTTVRAAKRFVNTPPPPKPPPRTGTWGEVGRSVALRLLLVFSLHLALFETLEQLSVHWKESTSELWGITLAIVTLGGLVWACWPGYRLRRSWLFCLGGTIGTALVLLAIVNYYSWHLRPTIGLSRQPDWMIQQP